MPDSVRRHSIALLACAALTIFWLLPVLRHLYTGIPGAGPGDNLTFLWDLWWMRYVLHDPRYTFFSTPFLFHPFGVDLTLHTHTALPALAAALVGPRSLIASQNLLVLVHVFLNFVCSYALAYRATHRTFSALVAAVIFGCSPFVSAHLAGHFNLVAAWVVPLTGLLAWRAEERPSTGAAALLGAALGAAAYVDYYLFVFACALVAIRLVARVCTIGVREAARTPLRRRLATAVIVLLALDAAVVAWILLARTDRIEIGPVEIAIRGIGNPVTFAWILTLALVVLRLPRFRVTFHGATARSALRLTAVSAVVALSLLMPLLVSAATLWRDGNYASQQYHWRSAPAGIDVATLVIGSPFSRWWGTWAGRAYSSLNIDPIESCGWIPLCAIALGAVAIWARRRDAVVRAWTLTGAIFLIWSLGPWLVLFGRRSPLLLPGLALRFVPIVANARMPGRAMLVVYLAVAMLAGVGCAWLLARGGRTRVLGAVLGALAIVECVPASPPIYSPEAASLYMRLKEASQPGAVCELPLGLRDGFGEIGRFDGTALFHQTIHERPIVGGFVARLPPRIAPGYARMPVIGSLLRLSAGAPLSGERADMDPGAAAAYLTSAGIRYLVLDRRTAPPDLVRYVESAITLNVIAQEGSRTLYEVPLP